MANPDRRARIGLLLLGSNVHKGFGENTEHGSYVERVQKYVNKYIAEFDKLGDVTFSEIVFNQDAARKSIDAFFNAKVDCVIIINLSWTEDSGLICFLRNMPPVPMLFAAVANDDTQLESTADDDGFTTLLTVNSLVGSLECSGAFRRFNTPMCERVSGTFDKVFEKAKVFVAASRARGILRESDFALLGPYNEVMWSTYVDPYSLYMDVGPNIHFYSVSQLKESIDKVSDSDVRSAMERIVSTYPSDGPVDEEKFFGTVKASLGFDYFCKDHGIDCMVLNDIDKALLDVLGCRPGFIWSSGENNAVVVPEGDIGSGVAAYTLRLLSGHQVNYIEGFFIQHKEQWIAVGHGGPNDYRDPEGKCIISTDIRYANADIKYPGAPLAWYTFPTGEITVLHSSQNMGKQDQKAFKFVAGRAESLETKHFMSSFTHGKIRPIGAGCEEWVQKLIDEGVTQHYAITKGDYKAEIECLSKLINFNYVDLEK